MKKARCLELRTADGKIILVLYLTEKEVVLEDDPAQLAEKKPESKQEKPKARKSRSQFP